MVFEYSVSLASLHLKEMEVSLISMLTSFESMISKRRKMVSARWAHLAGANLVGLLLCFLSGNFCKFDLRL